MASKCPRSGRRRTFPEVDRAAVFDLETAKRKILEAQAPLVDELREVVGEDVSSRQREEGSGR